MKTSVLFLAAVGAALLCHAPAARAQQYKLDDGTAENAYAFGNATNNYGSIWLNEFPVTPGSNAIGSLDIAWGNPGGTLQNVNGLPMTALLYNDPNGDGSPLDATLVGSATGTIQSVGTNTFVKYAFPSAVTISTANFFVGYYVPTFVPAGGVEQYFAAINTSAGSISSRSFVFANLDGSTPSLTSLGSNTFGGSNPSIGIVGNWLVRANPVPEPSTWVLLGTGLGAGGLYAHRRSRAA